MCNKSKTITVYVVKWASCSLALVYSHRECSVLGLQYPLGRMPGRNGVLLIIVCQVLQVAAQVKGNCRKTGPCSCESDEGIIDLSPLASNGDATFKHVESSTFYGWQFSWNPCLPFTEGTCQNVAVCEMSDDYSAFYNVGRQDSATFSASDSGVLQLSYNSSDGGNRLAYVILVCDPDTEKSLQVLGPTAVAVFDLHTNGDGHAACSYSEACTWMLLSITMHARHPIAMYIPHLGFVLTSKYCCPQLKTTGLSVGSILVIVFFALLVIYFVVGVVFQVGIRKTSGKDIIPNYTLWSTLPGLIKDGVKFTVSCGKMSYNKM